MTLRDEKGRGIWVRETKCGGEGLMTQEKDKEGERERERELKAMKI